MKTISIVFAGEQREFKVVPETEPGCCIGCVAYNDVTLCDQLNKSNCAKDGKIFVEISFTLDQIETAWKDTFGTILEQVIARAEFIKVLTRAADPEYNEYKRLQSKFEV